MYWWVLGGILADSQLIVRHKGRIHAFPIGPSFYIYLVTKFCEEEYPNNPSWHHLDEIKKDSLSYVCKVLTLWLSYQGAVRRNSSSQEICNLSGRQIEFQHLSKQVYKVYIFLVNFSFILSCKDPQKTGPLSFKKSI